MQNWTVQARKGLIELWLMGHLGQGQSYGYQLGQIMFEAGGYGITRGPIYPILARLLCEGCVSVHKAVSPLGPPRQYYRLTSAGEQRLRQMKREWRTLARITERALKS